LSTAGKGGKDKNYDKAFHFISSVENNILESASKKNSVFFCASKNAELIRTYLKVAFSWMIVRVNGGGVLLGVRDFPHQPDKK
jgi:hypothetical protein